MTLYEQYQYNLKHVCDKCDHKDDCVGYNCDKIRQIEEDYKTAGDSMHDEMMEEKDARDKV